VLMGHPLEFKSPARSADGRLWPYRGKVIESRKFANNQATSTTLDGRLVSWSRCNFRCVSVLACVLFSSGCTLNPPLATSALQPHTELADLIAANVQSLFAFFAKPVELPGELASFLSDEDFAFRRGDQTVNGQRDLVAFASRNAEPFVRIEFDIGDIRITEDGPDVVRAEFEVDRRAWDDSDLLHVSRTRHTWRIGVTNQHKLLLLDAQEFREVPHPGTGSKVICL